MLEANQSKMRQKRLLPVMQSLGLDAVAVGLPHHVYYFSGYLPHWTHHAAMVIESDGRSWLATPNAPATEMAADEVVGFEANTMGTQRMDQPDILATKIAAHLADRGLKRIGVDASHVTARLAIHLSAHGSPGHATTHASSRGESHTTAHNTSRESSRGTSHLTSIDEPLWQLRRRKDHDELALMKTAIRCTLAMHKKAKEIIEPGVSELEVFTQLHAAAVLEAGEPMTALLGNDYACRAPGGPPRDGHVAKSGELYILDLGPTFRGYFADNARTIAVNRKPTEAQHRAWEAVIGCHHIVEKTAKPGVKAKDLFAAVNEYLHATVGHVLPHHLGHGVGLQPHEYPHLNPHWDDVLQEGEVIAVEPGIYGPHLTDGLRVEDQYLVTADGVENLVNYPRGLA